MYPDHSHFRFFLGSPSDLFSSSSPKIPPSPIWVIHTLVVAWSNFLKVDPKLSMCETLGSTSCTNKKTKQNLIHHIKKQQSH